MKFIFRKLLPLLLPVLLIRAGPTAFAADNTLVYDGTSADYVFDCDGSPAPNLLFAGLPRALPGDTVYDLLLLEGNPGPHTEACLYLMAEGIPEEIRDYLLSQVLLVIKGGDKRTVYRGTAEKAADWIYLGTYRSGDRELLELELTLSQNLEMRYLPTLSGLRWRILAQELPLSTDPAYWNGTDVIPKTEDPSRPEIWASVLLFSAGGLILLLSRRRSHII